MRRPPFNNYVEFVLAVVIFVGLVVLLVGMLDDSGAGHRPLVCPDGEHLVVTPSGEGRCSR